MLLDVEDFLPGLRKNFKMSSELTGVVGQLLTPDQNNTDYSDKILVSNDI